MTDSAETVEIPFVTIGNRRGLTATQIMEFPWLADFYRRFKSSFEPCFDMDAVLFIEPIGVPESPSESPPT